MTMEVDHPPLGELPIEKFESLETLELVNGGNTYFSLVRPYRHSASSPLVIPFPALRELQITFDPNISLDTLAKVLMARKQAGHGVETARIRGVCSNFMDGPITKMREFLGELVLELTHRITCTGHSTL